MANPTPTAIQTSFDSTSPSATTKPSTGNDSAANNGSVNNGLGNTSAARVATDRTHPARPTRHRWLIGGTLAGLLLGTALLYLWSLSESGYANEFYSAAAQAGSMSWKAFFFGSLDAANSITVDKPPAALWLMSLSVRLFGLSSWSILVPQALLGVASVAVLYATLARVLAHRGAGAEATAPLQTHWAALAGAAIFAVTPAATLMFRFNNPDALLVFLLTLASYATLRATERARPGWLVFAGVLIGFGFLTKMLQAFLVLPALVAAYAIAAPTTWRKKITHLLAAFGAMLVSLGWYVAVVELVPESWRPYIGGSQNNSLTELIFGYNGLGRITGNEVGSVTGGGGMGNMPGGGMWGSASITRMFDGVSGGMVAWLIPAALILTIAALAILSLRHRLRGAHDVGGPAAGLDVQDSRPSEASPVALQRAALVVFGGSLVTTALVFSFMAGIYHDYYTVALAPAIGASVALGFTVLWRARAALPARIAMAIATWASGVWAVVLLNRAGGGYATAGIIAAVVAAVSGLGLLLANRLPRVLAAGVLAAAFAAAMTGPTAYSINTALTPHKGSIVTAGPVSGMGGPGGMPGGEMGRDGQGMPQPPNGQQLPGGQGPGGQLPGGQLPGGQGPGGQAPNGQTVPGQSPTQNGPAGRGGPGGMGGMMGGAEVPAELKSTLLDNATAYTWVAATVGSQSSASYQLATGFPVMALGGFNGSDPSPTLAEFQQLVANGEIHYFVTGGMGAMASEMGGGPMGGQQNGGSSAASEISTWVSENYTTTTVGETTVYDLTQAN